MQPNKLSLILPVQNGQRAAEALLQCCQAHGSRFSLLAEQPCVGLLQSPSGSIQGVVTSSSRYSQLFTPVATLTV